MCEINPQHTLHFKLEAFTSHEMSQEDFDNEVRTRVLLVEQQLNADGRFRFHVHEDGELVSLDKASKYIVGILKRRSFLLGLDDPVLSLHGPEFDKLVEDTKKELRSL